MRKLLVVAMMLCGSSAARSEDVIYEGTWFTTNRNLDGTMTCVITDLGGDRWHGHFHGIWQERPFSYKVHFTGPPDKLQGTAVVDGANYTWSGSMSMRSAGWLRGTFGGDRYAGAFDLKRKQSTSPSTPAR